MSSSQKFIPYVLYALVLISSVLVGLSLDSNRLIAIAVIGATLGFLVADVLKLFRIRGVLANIASIVILLLAMKDFLPGDSTGKLISVANLLVYLQTVLMFQEKTPRLNWQILILSLLQVVVAAIFSLNFEAGLLFLLYFFAVAVALLIQASFTDQYEIRTRNRLSTNTLKQNLSDHGTYREKDALTFFDSSNESGVLKSMTRTMGFWMLISLIFTGVMFSQIPRHSRSWFGPARMDVASTSVSKSVDLDKRGLLEQSGRVMFRVEITDNKTGASKDLEVDPPYFRGMALSSLVIEDGKTNWRAPHDRVFNGLYEQLRLQNGVARTASQKMKFEESSDPLVYPTMPVCRSSATSADIMFCHEISAITRCKLGRKIDISPFTYEATILLNDNGRFSETWPFLSNMGSDEERPMSVDPPQHEWLTLLDESRYPKIVADSNQLAETNRGLGRMQLLKKFEAFFITPFGKQFTYTLDFRKVKRIESVDPVEDFFANHRSGHCELFASALALMLRQQDIPTRVVLGFHGVEKNQFTGEWIVRERNAHAWVEAYLRPEDCTEEMLQNGLASAGGAWMRLDPTPGSGVPEANVGEEAIDLARNVWDDYVLGNDEDGSLTNEANSAFSILGFLDSTDFQKWERRVDGVKDFTNTRAFKFGAGTVIMVLFLIAWYRAAEPNEQRKRKTGRLRRLFAGAISLISPELGKWVMAGSSVSRPTAFYERMSKLLAPHGLERSPSQTHREFASAVATKFSDHPESKTIQSSVFAITKWFNEVRFGEVNLDDASNQRVNASLESLEQVLAMKGEPEN